MFDRPLALWQELQSMLGGPDTLTTFQLPKFEWVQPTLEFLSPTFAEFLLFIATLILFIASWQRSAPRHDHELRRPRRRGCGRCGSSTRSRSISATIC